MKIDENTRVIGGNVSHRRFAYLGKNDHRRYGLLQAANKKDARQFLGTKFYIRETWLTEQEEAGHFEEWRCWEIVSSIFLSPLSVDFIGTEKAKATNNRMVCSWVVEFSRRQRWFRVDKLEEVVSKNLRLLMSKTPSDFTIVYVGTSDECWEVCSKIQKKMRLADGKLPEFVNQALGESSELKRLKNRVIELENQLEAMMGYP